MEDIGNGFWKAWWRVGLLAVGEGQILGELMMIRLMRITIKYLNPLSKYNTSKKKSALAWLFIHLLYWYINRPTSCSIVDHMLIVAVVSWCPGPRHLHYGWHNLHPLPLTHTPAGLDCTISSSTNPPSVRLLLMSLSSSPLRFRNSADDVSFYTLVACRLTSCLRLWCLLWYPRGGVWARELHERRCGRWVFVLQLQR